MRVNAIHAALLHTGKVLIIAGSGNDRKQFDAGKFKTILWDPETDKFKRIHTPSDMFCAGHAFLPDGKLLIAGGTRRYEKLEEDVKRAAGVMTIKNESPDGGPLTLEKGTEFVSPGGPGVPQRPRRSSSSRRSRRSRERRTTTVTASSTEVWVEAVDEGNAPVVERPTQFTISGSRPRQRRRVRLRDLADARQAGLLGRRQVVPVRPRDREVRARRQHDARALVPDARRASRTAACCRCRASTSSAASSRATTRSTTPRPSSGRPQPQLQAHLPHLPVAVPDAERQALLHRQQRRLRLGHGRPRPRHLGPRRQLVPTRCPGCASRARPRPAGASCCRPAQDQRYMIAGGGGIGDSDKSTARTDVIDLSATEPHFEPGPGPGEAGALPEHGDHARRQGRDHGRVDRLPRRGRQRRAALPHLRPEDGRARRAWPIRRSGATTTPRRCCCRTAG